MPRYLTLWLLSAILLLGTSVSAQNAPEFPSPSLATPEKIWMTEVKSLRVCFVIYRIGSRKQERMSDEKVLELRAAGELARLFYFRASGARLNLDIQYILLDAPLPRAANTIHRGFDADLKAKGAQVNAYDLLFITGPDTVFNLGGTDFLGDTVGAVGGSKGVAPLANYPENQPGINYGAAWIFAHEIHHALDRLIEKNRAHDLLHCHPYTDHAHPSFKPPYHAAREWDWLALTIREYPRNEWIKIRGILDLKLQCSDSDSDGFPDDDERLPFDEKRFGSSDMTDDSDGDGLRDVDEFGAGIYGGSNPNLPDTDGDGLSDKEDPSPLLAVARTIPYGATASAAAPILEGAVARTDGEGRVAAYAAWKEDGLYFWFLAPRKMKVRLELDGDAENGYWKGGKSFLLTLSETGAIYDGLGLNGEIKGAAGGVTLATLSAYGLQIFLPAKLGQGVSAELNWGGTRAPEDVSSGLDLVAGRKIALNIAFDFEDGTHALLSPNFTLASLELAPQAPR